MAKLIGLLEAAEMLGISPDELTDMRSRNEIFGYRDGSTWKFKLQELERIKATRGLSGGDDDADEFGAGILGETLTPDEPEALSDLKFNLDADDDADVIELSARDDSDSILVSEEELGKSDENTASTIIGEADELLPQDSGITGGSDALAGMSDLQLSPASDALSKSDVLGGLSGRQSNASDTSNLARLRDSGSDLRLEGDSGSGSLDLDLDDVVDGGSRIELSDDARSSSSGFGSAIDLGLDEDELVLGSGTGSDVTLGAGDSGISLSNPSDSGISLEEPLELGSGSGVESLELGEDEELISLDETLIPDGGSAESDFLLEPMDEGLEEDSESSGSQVIALDSAEFEGEGIEMLEEGASPLEEEETEEFLPANVGRAAAAGAAAVVGPSMAAAIASADDEANYSVWNILSLVGVATMLGLTGIFLLDIVSNIWTWDQPFSFSSKLMDAILGMMPG